MKTQSSYRWCEWAMWAALACFLAVCVFFQIHNAQWLMGDEAIVFSHTGVGKAFSFRGFEGMITSYGRLYPFAYTFYNILLPFYDGYIPPSAIYTLQGISLSIFAVFFALVALRVLRDVASPWKYAIVFFFTAICVFRVYTEFITCYTGMWIVFLFLPIFLFFTCRFMESEHWGDGVIALLSITYIIYCYETIFVIPLTLGACELLFQYRKLTPRKRVFCLLLVGSGLLFLALYAILVLPNAHNFYHHYGSTTFLQNAIHMFMAHKLYWLASVVLVIRFIEVVFKKKPYSFFDSLLLASFAYFLGAAVLKLDYTYYYNVGALVGLAASLYHLKGWIKPEWICLLMLAFALFYGRKMPGVVRRFQKERTVVSSQMNLLSDRLDKQESIFWYEPMTDELTVEYLDFRESARMTVEAYLGWLRKGEVSLERRQSFDGSDGIWLVYSGKHGEIPKTPEELAPYERVFATSLIYGYQCE